MSLGKLTACPLDCYDGCSIVYKDGKLDADKNHPVTQGFLCSKMNRFLDERRLDIAYYRGKAISLEKALEILKEKLKLYENENNLFFNGSGNLGKMQNSTKHFFANFGFVGVEGSLCDGAGDTGIKEGRGADLLLPISEIKKSEVVIIWGRNPENSNTHMLPFLKDKKLIVIDPRKTKLAENADMFLQVKPRGDIYLALLMARVVYMLQEEDSEFIESKSENFEDFVELFETYTINELCKRCGIELEVIYDILDMLIGKKVSILVGIGVQKYLIGHYVLRAIDSFAVTLGLFGKEGCGVSYLSDSSFGFCSLWDDFKDKKSVASVDFSKYSMVFIQNANPLVSLPNTKRVEESISKSKFVVYFGLYKNETSEIADLVIPAVTFLAKNDIKSTYGNEYIFLMPKLREEESISEYELSNYLFKSLLNRALKEEKEYIREFLKSNSIEKDGYLISKTYLKTPYLEGFYTDSGKFYFLDEFEDDFEDDYLDDEGFYLLSIKHKKALNSSFFRDDFLYVPDNLSLSNGDRVEVSSPYGRADFEVRVDKNLRSDTLMCYAGNRKFNYLSPSMVSLEGECAVFQEMKVDIKRLL